MIIHLCIKFYSNIPIFSKDILWKPFVLRTGWTDGMDGQDGQIDETNVRMDSGDTICTPTENGGGKK